MVSIGNRNLQQMGTILPTPKQSVNNTNRVKTTIIEEFNLGKDGNPRIIKGSGEIDDRYELDGNDNDADLAYLQALANKNHRDYYFRLPDGRKGRVYPD